MTILNVNIKSLVSYFCWKSLPFHTILTKDMQIVSGFRCFGYNKFFTSFRISKLADTNKYVRPKQKSWNWSRSETFDKLDLNSWNRLIRNSQIMDQNYLNELFLAHKKLLILSPKTKNLFFSAPVHATLILNAYSGLI